MGAGRGGGVSVCHPPAPDSGAGSLCHKEMLSGRCGRRLGHQPPQRPPPAAPWGAPRPHPQPPWWGEAGGGPRVRMVGMGLSQHPAERGSEGRDRNLSVPPPHPPPPSFVSGETEARRCLGGWGGGQDTRHMQPAGVPSAMRTLLLLWLALAGAGAWLPCPEGQPCPVTPVLPASSVALCQDGTPCPAAASCPLPEGVLCAGGHRCCPQGSRCSADGESCIAAPAPRAVPCPDGQSECPDDATCCVTATGAWGCCPMPQASCCADKVHCCPHATLCDLAHGRCLSPAGDIPLATKFPAWKRQPPASVALRQVLCPDGRSACPDGATCCQLSSTQYGCCPLQNAVCCGDRRHCCPQGTTCDLERSTCTSARPLPALPKASDVRCDEETSCPDGNTCCRLSSGAWGCCPLEQAVCCPDHVHCCPQGYTCDPAGGSCLQEGGGRRPWLQKSPALARGGAVVARGGDVRCDEETSCPDGNTCCQLSLGTWGCCPLEQAVCCRDHQHCCPRGYTCNVAAQSCEKLLAPTPLLPAPAPPLRLPAPPHHPPNPPPALLRATSTQPGATVPCDAANSCRLGQRCCRSRGGSWGCCPFTQGSCCSDGRHCCPGGSRCSRGGQGCSPQRWDLPAPRRVLL